MPLENGWQCTLIPGPQYYDLTAWGRGYRNMSARALYPNAGRDNSAYSWNTRPLSEVDKSELWEKDRIRQLAEDRATFLHRFRPNWDLRTITGRGDLEHVQRFLCATMDVLHSDEPTDNESVQRVLCGAVASGHLVPVVNHEYRGLPRVSQPTPGPLHWPATRGGGSAYPPKVISYPEFVALQRANGELPPLDAPAGGVGATLDPLPDLGAPATADDVFGLTGVVESATGALLGGDDSDDGGGVGGDDSGASDDDLFSADSGDGSTPLGDAQPFEYSDDSNSGDVTDLAARGVSEEHEAECFDQYQRDMDECTAYRSAMGGQRFMDACSQRAFQNYQQCRGY